MRTGLAVGIGIIGAAGIAGCVDEPTALVKPAEDGRDAAQADAPTEPGVRLRLQLRARDDSAFERRVAESDNVVTVGFRQAGAFRGVSAGGEVVVPAGERSQRVAAVEAMAEEVIYELGGIPAVTIRVEQPSMADTLKSGAGRMNVLHALLGGPPPVMPVGDSAPEWQGCALRRPRNCIR